MKKGLALRSTLRCQELCSLFLASLKVLHIDSLHQLSALLYRRLLKGLAISELADDAGLLELSLEFLKCPLYVLAVLNRNDNHALYHLLFLCGLQRYEKKLHLQI